MHFKSFKTQTHIFYNIFPHNKIKSMYQTLPPVSNFQFRTNIVRSSCQTKAHKLCKCRKIHLKNDETPIESEN